jgi:DNA-binding NarL/FixJ family response regulator
VPYSDIVSTEQHPLSSIRVLIADDYKDWRRQVRLLFQARPQWQLIDASDGSEAVQKVKELKPDLVVLDIGLPKLNGIEAARQIRRVSPSSKIVFLSENNDLDVVRAALSTGAHGYVRKTDAQSELLPAVDAVLRGKQYVSSSLKNCEFAGTSGEKPPHSHDALFYSDDTVFLDGFALFISAALKAGNAAIALVTKSHRDSLLQRLKAESVHVDGAIQQGTLILLDVADTLATLSVDGLLDPVRVSEGFSGLIQAASKAAKAEHPRVVICCECKGSLWAEGKTDAAILLEQSCNEIAKTHEVDMLCAYPLSAFHGEEDEPVLQSIYAEHSGVHSW